MTKQKKRGSASLRFASSQNGKTADPFCSDPEGKDRGAHETEREQSVAQLEARRHRESKVTGSNPVSLNRGS